MTRGLPAALATLVLAGCATVPPPQPPDAASEPRWEQHRRAVESQQDWGARGRYGFVTAEGSVHGDFDWWVHSDCYTLALRGPFGVDVARIEGSFDSRTARVHAGEETGEGDVQELLRHYLGAALPVSLSDWARLLRGLPPRPQTEVRLRLDAQARAASIRAADWAVEYPEYRGTAPALPVRIRLRSAPLRGTVAVREWLQP